ncbi:transmembrane secretion effector domain protein [Olsenella profusa F0195]|uniref:Transmembrane secretion effector domain protein n=1 Tax=Olsenella profusa F0195 TaxID=1125712 RepID=U2V6A1_9ACTN|nr:transmembrane secretion effector domain protein [Olsenella profusa F0195]
MGGVVADRFDRKRILVVADMLSAFVCLVAAAFFVTPVFVYALISANVLLSAASGFYLPAYHSVLPFLVRKSQISNADSHLELAAHKY